MTTPPARKPNPKLREYLRSLAVVQRYGRHDLAKRVGIHYLYLYQLSTGVRRPSLDLARRIERATNGFVPMSSWTFSPRARLPTTEAEDSSVAG